MFSTAQKNSSTSDYGIVDALTYNDNLRTINLHDEDLRTDANCLL